MSERVIPAEAAEAAARALTVEVYGVDMFDGMSGDAQEVLRRRGTFLLEAAAPYMLAPIYALVDGPEHYDSQGPSSGYVSVDNLRAVLSNARATFEAASPGVVREALAKELAELAELIEPYSGIGLANGATRSEVAQWIRNRAAGYRTTDGDD